MAKVIDKKSLQEWDLLVAQRKKASRLNIDYNQTPKEREAFLDDCRKDYALFVREFLPQYATAETPDFHIKDANKVKRNKEIKIWLQYGRGLAKSVLADVTIPLWLWINNDINFMVLIGQNEDKAERLSDDLRMEFEANEKLIHYFGVQKGTKQWASGDFITQNGFICKALGMGQDPRGLRVVAERPDYISCDDWEDKDTVKNERRQREIAHWMKTAVLPIVDGDVFRVLLAQNGFTNNMIFKYLIEDTIGWVISRINAYCSMTKLPRWASKYSKGYYKKREAVMGVLAAESEYNNNPHIEGKIFLDEYIQWTKLPRIDSFDAIVGMWDVAFAGTKTADYNALRVWGIKGHDKYLIDCFVKKSRVTAPLEWMAEFQTNLPSKIKVPFYYERQFWNQEITLTIKEIEKKKGISLNLAVMDRSTVNKYVRMLEMHPSYQNGRVWYNEKLKNHNDTQVGLAQLKSIEPNYKGHDDAPDADKYAFDYLDAFRPTDRRKHTPKVRENNSY